jgi:CHAT domain-containing protein
LCCLPLARTTAATARRPDQLSKAIPAGVALVDLLEYDHITPPKGPKGKLHQERRLLAFVLLREKEPLVISLGAMKPIEEAVARWRREVQKEPARSNRKAVDQASRTLRRRVWEPLTGSLAGVKTVLVSPDGVLCQFPLAALPSSKQGSYLIEEVAIAQVSSAHELLDLLRPTEKPKGRPSGLLAVGGVDYGPGKAYAALPGTGLEAQRCCELFRRAFPKEPATLLDGKESTVAAVKQAVRKQRPVWLHLATHGFFEPPDRALRLLAGAAGRSARLSLWQEQTTPLRGLPLLRCGLVLAGANQVSTTGDPAALPAVLTGEDVEGLDLRGCELAVLSSCQTGLGWAI